MENKIKLFGDDRTHAFCMGGCRRTLPMKDLITIQKGFMYRCYGCDAKSKTRVKLQGDKYTRYVVTRKKHNCIKCHDGIKKGSRVIAATFNLKSISEHVSDYYCNNCAVIEDPKENIKDEYYHMEATMGAGEYRW